MDLPLKTRLKGGGGIFLREWKGFLRNNLNAWLKVEIMIPVIKMTGTYDNCMHFISSHA